MKKNDIVTLEITALAGSGEGIGRHEGMVVFVPNTAKGDVCEVRILKVLSGRAIGKAERVITPSPDRTENTCPVFPGCGGCQFRHITYERELQVKKDCVRDALTRIGDCRDLPDFEILGADRLTEYRNKALYPLAVKNGRITFGFFRAGTHTVMETDSPCALHPAFFHKVAQTVCEWATDICIPVYDEVTGKGSLRNIYLRYAETSGELMVCLVSTQGKLHGIDDLISKLQQLNVGFSTLVLNVNSEKTNGILGRKCIVLYGSGNITDRISDIRLEISPLSFYQVNRAQCERLYGKVGDYLTQAADDRKPNLLDLYCGVGSIGLTVAKRCNRLVGVEIIPAAIENAKRNATLNNLNNTDFFCSDAAGTPEVLKKADFTPDVICVDPPRKGLSADVTNFLKQAAPAHLIYVSCEPTTLARDLKLLSDMYQVEALTAVDLFPRTANVETVVLLSKLDEAKHRITVELKTDELDLTSAEAKASYDEIKEYIKQRYNLTVSHLNIAQVKRKNGIIERENYNLPKNADSKQPKCTPEKEAVITEALKHFKMIKTD